MKKYFPRLIISIVLFVIMASTCWAASGPEVAKFTGNLPTGPEITYKSPMDAIKNLDFTYLTNNTATLDGEQKNFLYSFQALLDNDLSEAEKGFLTLARSATGPEVKQQSIELLTQTLFYQSAWNKLLELKRDCPVDNPGLNQIFSWADAYSGCPPESYAFEKKETVIPLKLNSFTGHPLLEVEIQGKKYLFVIDTGAPITIISSEVAQNAAINPISSIIIGTSAEYQTINAQIAKINMGFGNVVIQNHPVIIVERRQMEFKMLGIKITKFDGILGWNAIKNLTLKIDYTNKKLVVKEPELNISKERNLFWCGENLPLVKLKTPEGLSLNFGLDTGSINSVIFESIFDKVPSESVKTKTIKTFGIGYSSKKVVKVLPDLVLIIDNYAFHYKNIESTQSFQSFVHYDGWLGLDIFKKGSMEIDAINGVVNLDYK